MYIKTGRTNREKVILGTRYGMFTIIEDLGSVRAGRLFRTKVRLRCDCGNIVDRLLHYVKNGGSKSCGCLRKKMATEWGKVRWFKHGKSGHPLMRVWDGMIQRCGNTKNKSYQNYGGIGIVVCKEWAESYEVFYDWGMNNGWERGLQLDKDIIPQRLGKSAKIYSPETCCFVTKGENNRARKDNINITFKGDTMCLTDWASRIGVSFATMKYRIKNWPLELAITTPIITRYADRIKTC